jgi:hypothetical protein
VQGPAVAVRSGRQGEGGGVGAGVGLGEREGGHDVAGHDPGQPALAGGVVAGLQDGVGAEPLERQRRLGLGVDRGERLAEQAQLHGRGIAPWHTGLPGLTGLAGLAGLAAEQPAQEAGVTERLDQRPVDRPVHGRDVGQRPGRPGARPHGVLLLAGRESERRPAAHASDHTGDRIAP